MKKKAQLQIYRTLLQDIKSQKAVLEELKEKVKKIRNTEVGTIEVTHIDLLQAVLQKPYPSCQILQSFPLSPAISS